jgi:selenocysteine lyase/cysteine desulfurase
VTRTVDEYAGRFGEDPGYLDYARFGPLGRTVLEEEEALRSALIHARFGSLAPLGGQHDRMRAAASALLGLPADRIVFQPNTSQGLLHAMFGITGGIAVSPGEFAAITVAIDRASHALGVLTHHPLATDHGRVTPGNLRDQLTGSIAAVAVSLVDERTGYLVDLDGIRQVIGDRLLVVDATQALGIVDAPYEVADVVAAGGQTWARAGWGTGLLALSDRALERLTPVWSGHAGAESDVSDPVPPPARGAVAFQTTHADPLAQCRLAAALEEIAGVGVSAISERIARHVSRIIDLADEYAVPVVSSRAEPERAGIVVLEPPSDRLNVLAASLHNHGVTATTRGQTVRLSAHASTEEETFAMLRSALLSYSTAQ